MGMKSAKLIVDSKACDDTDRNLCHSLIAANVTRQGDVV